MRAFWKHRPSPATAIACVALIVALGGTGYAAVTLPANSVGTAQLKKNAVTSLKVKNGSLLLRTSRQVRFPQDPPALRVLQAQRVQPARPGPSPMRSRQGRRFAAPSTSAAPPPRPALSRTRRSRSSTPSPRRRR